jgi:hypothetical protein
MTGKTKGKRGGQETYPYFARTFDPLQKFPAFGGGLQWNTSVRLKPCKRFSSSCRFWRQFLLKAEYGRSKTGDLSIGFLKMLSIMSARKTVQNQSHIKPTDVRQSATAVLVKLESDVWGMSAVHLHNTSCQTRPVRNRNHRTRRGYIGPVLAQFPLQVNACQGASPESRMTCSNVEMDPARIKQLRRCQVRAARKKVVRTLKRNGLSQRKHNSQHNDRLASRPDKMYLLAHPI